MINTGIERACDLTVSRMMNGMQMDGYPRTYRLTDEFGMHGAISKEEVGTMAREPYVERLESFTRYVESVEIGVKINTDEAYRKNLTACPI